MTLGDLFTGIGGFSLAAQWMGWDITFQVERDPFCQKVLTKNFPHVKRYGDIKQFDGTPYRGTIDILTGGFPCQPYSMAGKRKGKEDERHLWPEMLRIIREVQPTYVVGENVHGLVNWSGGMVFDEVQANLEAEGFEVTSVVLPACGINAPHRRERIWFIAYSRRNGHRRQNRPMQDRCAPGEGISLENKWKWFWSNSWRNGSERPTTNTTSERCGKTRQHFIRSEKWPARVGRERNAAQPERIGLQNGDGEQGRWNAQSRFEGRNGSHNWGEEWPTQSPICGGNDGIPNRVDRIKSLGNAIVPQVALEIFKAIEMTQI